METNQAAENLQVIRTLMERSALYRRALAPIMTTNGLVGIGGGIAGWQLKIDSSRGFVLLWMGIALIALVVSFLQVRRQALREAEPFWSPPTRRVAQGLFMPLLVGGTVGLLSWLFSASDYLKPCAGLPVVWMLFYGCALNAAGFFMQRGIKWVGWIMVSCGLCLMSFRYLTAAEENVLSDHRAMALVFGGVHLAYGIYLYLTEPRKNVA